LPLLVDEKRKTDSCFLAEEPCIVHVAQPYGGKLGFLLAKLLFMRAQLRDVFATENSTIVTQKNQHGRAFLPQRSKTHHASIDAGKGYVRKFAAERFSHGGTFS
jgi:hypothetical protein